MNDEVQAALIAAAFGILAAVITTLLEHRRYKSQLKADAEQQAQQLQETFRLQEERLKAELRTEFMAESAIQQLLTKSHEKRSFKVLEKRIGGFEKDELRKLLVRSGAVRFYRHEDDGSLTEFWGLRTRNVEAANRDDDAAP